MRCEYRYDENNSRVWDSEDENAYHEAAHAVTAADRGLLLLPGGVIIYEHADESRAVEGFTCYRQGDDLNDPVHRERVLVALIAGIRAQQRKFPESVMCGRGPDITTFFDILDRFDPQRESVERVNKTCAQVLTEHWGAIEAIAAALLNCPWQDTDETERANGWGRKRQLDGKSVAAILTEHGITLRPGEVH